MRADAVTPELHHAIMARDRICFLTRLDSRHECSDRFGNRHASTDTRRLTLDHFWLHPGGTKGKRAPSDAEHLVAMCGLENNRPPSAKTREAERDYVEKLFPGARQREETRAW